MIKMAYEMDQLFDDIISECLSGELFSQFSNSVRDRLEQYDKKVRKEIVSRTLYESDWLVESDWSDEVDNTYTPLICACKRGNVEMVEYLISTCDADVEQRGWWNEYEEMVSPLWYAAATCDKPIIECLVRHGAQVNAVSGIGTTPVQVACSQFDNIDSSDFVEYLVEHGADIHRANDNGRTCLMLAVHNVKMCEFLLKNGVDVNARHTISNLTALHMAISRELLATVKLLLDYGADVTLKSLVYSSDALQTACLRHFRPIFDYLVERGSYSPGRLADANELMGTRCLFNDPETSLEYWRKAIEIRHSNTVGGNPLAKTPAMPKRDCYRNASEFTTFDELDAIALDSDALNIQKLLIYDRILGEHNGATFNAIDRIAVLYYTEPLLNQHCFDLWRTALELGADVYAISWDTVADVAQDVVRTVLHSSYERILEIADVNVVKEEQSRFADAMAIFQLLTNNLVTARRPFEERIPGMYEYEGRSYDMILRCIIQLIDLLVKTASTSKAADEVRALVRRLVNHNLMTLWNRDTLLHLSLSEIFPNLEVTKLLLECKADVHTRNEDGETPLYIASCSEDFSNQIVKLLLDHGAHLDTPDKSGSTPAHILSAKPDNTVNLGNYMMLKCHAAQAVVKYAIPCNDLPATLNQFLDLHRPLSIKTTILRGKHYSSG